MIIKAWFVGGRNDFLKCYNTFSYPSLIYRDSYKWAICRLISLKKGVCLVNLFENILFLQFRLDTKVLFIP